MVARCVYTAAGARTEAAMLTNHPRLDTTCNALNLARQVLGVEAKALARVAKRLDASFSQTFELLIQCTGRIVVSGVGKSADVARKIVATLNSTGTRALFLDPIGALHGDLGSIGQDDVGLLLSHGGESPEIIQLIKPLRQLAGRVAAITSHRGNTLARLCDVAICYGPIEEADPRGLAPTTSTTVMMALGDALALALADARDFTAEEFAVFHPSGSLGLKLARVDQHMRTDASLRVASADESVRSVFAKTAREGRRSGAVLLVDSTGRLVGIFTDSDLARLFEQGGVAAANRPMREVMTTNPKTTAAGSKLTTAIELMKRRRISELPIIDEVGRPVGLLDITDLLRLMPGGPDEANHAA